MQRDPRAWLWHVHEAADAIADFTSGMSEEDYLADKLVRAAFERQFEVIGEALNLLARHAPELAGQIPRLPAIIGFRNLLIHGYAVVDDRTVWHNAQENLPGLRATVTGVLDKLGPPES